MKELNVAIVGATGAVGQELLKVIDEHKFPYKSLKMLASSRSAGKIINFQGKDYVDKKLPRNLSEALIWHSSQVVLQAVNLVAMRNLKVLLLLITALLSALKMMYR